MVRRDVIKLAGIAAASAFATRGSPIWGRQRTARSLYRNAIVIDGNMGIPFDEPTRIDASTAAEVRRSGLTAIKFTLGGSGSQSKAEVDAAIASLNAGIEVNHQYFTRIATVDDFDLAKKTRRTGIIFSFEAGEMLEGNVDNIDHFRTADVLVMGLSYNRATPFASGVLAPRSTGLTALGRQAIDRMNDLGVTVDISHSDEQSSSEAIWASKKPVLITHAGCAAIHPHPRNKSDALMRSLARRGGVMGIYELSYLAPPPKQPTLADYLAHLAHALNVCGEDHVGIGTDGSLTPFDTSPENMKGWYQEIARRKATGVGAPGEGPPPFVLGLNRSDRCLVIAEALLKKGYSSRVVDKVLGLNFQRVFSDTWRKR